MKGGDFSTRSLHSLGRNDTEGGRSLDAAGTALLEMTPKGDFSTHSLYSLGRNDTEGEDTNQGAEMVQPPIFSGYFS